MQFYAFSFIVVLSLTVEPVLSLRNQKNPSNVGLRKRNAFFNQGYFSGPNDGNESKNYLRFDDTERNGNFTEDRNDPRIGKDSRIIFPIHVNKRNFSYTLEYIFRKSRTSSAVQVSDIIHEGYGIRRRNTPSLERARRSVTYYSLNHGRKRETSPTHVHGADEMNATTFIKHDRRERRTDGKNVTSFIKHDRRERGSSPTKSTDGRNATSFIKHDRRERESSPTQSTDGRKTTTLYAYATAKNRVLQNRKNISYDGKRKEYTIREDNNRSRENRNSSYQSLNLVLKVLKGRKSFKTPVVNRKIACCDKGKNKTVPTVNLTLPSGRFSWLFRKDIFKITLPVQRIKWVNITTGGIHKIKSISTVFRPAQFKVRRLSMKCPKSKPIFDERSKTCKRKTTAPASEVRIAMIFTTSKNETNKTKTSNTSLEVTTLKTRTIKKNCTVLQKYEKHEYTMVYGDDSAVYIKMTGEVLQFKYYFKNLTSANDSQAIFVCRQHQIFNCSGVYILINEGEFRVLVNKSIFVNASKQVYDWSEYTWINKSVLVCENFSSTYYKTKVVPNDDPLLTTITLVCMSLSIIGLVFVLVTYSLFSELRTPPGINLMNLSASILLAQLLWILGSGQTDTPMACTVIAVILHYLFLVSFMWTSIIAFDTWRAFSGKGRRPLADSKAQRMKKCLSYMAVGWISVIVYVIMCVAFDKLNIATIGYGSAYGCWIAHYYAKLYFFGVPVLTSILFNLVFYSMTVIAIKKTRSETRLIDAEHLEKKKDFWIYVRIGALMGFTWIFGLAAPFGWQFLWYPFVILNSLQGVYIALAFGVNKRARKLYVDLVRGKKQVQEKVVSKQERSTKQSVVVLELHGLTPTHV